MKVIVDTVIWSLALRRTNPSPQVIQCLTTLIQEQRVILLGPIRQEVLSGYSDPKKFEQLRQKLSVFENEPMVEEDYEEAARFHNSCRKRGIQGSHTDFLICACAARLNAGIYTKDADFERFNTVFPISLYEFYS